MIGKNFHGGFPLVYPPRYTDGEMCRSIKVLRVPDHRATDDEVNAAALQFVRKISGFRKPSRMNQTAFDQAIVEIADASRRLLTSIEGGRERSSATSASRE